MDNVDVNRSIYVPFRLCLKHLARYLYKSSNELYLLTSESIDVLLRYTANFEFKSGD